ncbi:MAG: hypothetical protein J6T48_07030 [Bacteroidales bacterium]|nr:hypothetical protein [Bacteroidales bacterium]
MLVTCTPKLDCKLNWLKKILLLVLAGIIIIPASAQFYNGHQMRFGKNRVQFEEFEWYYYRHQQFDTYFYAGGSDMAEMASGIAAEMIPQLETFFDHKLEKRMILVLFQNLSDFRQSNIGLNTDADEYNIGGTLKVIDNIAFVYTEIDRQKFHEQVVAAITNIILNEIIYGSNIKNKIANNTLIGMPEWYTSGLVAYVSRDWDADADNINKVYSLSNKFKNINQLSGTDAEIMGFAIWNYVARTYGPQVISNIVYLTRITKSVESAFMYVLGANLKTLQENWTEYYKTQYEDFNATADEPQGEEVLKRNRKNVTYAQAQYNSNSDMMAWSENKFGKYWIKVHDFGTGKTKKIFRREHMLDQIIDNTYPIIRWHPSGKMLGFIIEKKGEIYYTTYQFETKEKKEIQMPSMEKINSFDYSADGQNIVFAGFNHGQSDIFIYSIASNTVENITNDEADDYDPLYVNKSKQIVFASKRDEDRTGTKKDNTIATQEFTDIFMYDIASKAVSRVTETPDASETMPFKLADKYFFLSDKNGVKNLYTTKLDSAISFIDTTTHYSYTYTTEQMSNYKFGIQNAGYDKFSNNIGISYRNENRFRIFKSGKTDALDDKPSNTLNRKLFDKAQMKQNSETNFEANVNEPQNTEGEINISNYSFDPEVVEKINRKSDEPKELKSSRAAKYHTTFYTNYIMTQVDFSYLFSSYQKYTGSAFYFNPGFNMVFKVGTADLFEDYRISAGFRFDVGLDGNEYLLTIENLKHRWNRQLVLHRQAVSDLENNFTKTLTHEAFYILRYPFSQVDAMQFSVNIRQNKDVFYATDLNMLEKKDNYDYWGSIKTEYIFDNSKELAINILSGIRFKVFAEAFMQFDKKKTDMEVIGADFRYYQPIHRSLIFAFRTAASASFGNAKLIYYLGGIDNWINVVPSQQMFNTNIKIDPEINYVYQAVATNLRGFSQNIRNGTNFAVSNFELRFPVISYFSRKPINNEFLKNFQIIGFFDAGMAWSGLNPYGGNNAYNNDYHEQYPVTVILNNKNNPLVAGYGVGIRSKLFGYFIRADWAWGINNGEIQKPMFYLSLNLDF